MAVQIEGNGSGEFLLSSVGNLSLDAAVVAAGQNLKAGAVIGRVTTSGEIAAWNPTATNGTETPAGVLFGDVDASLAAAGGTIVSRLAEVKGELLVFGTAVLEAAQETCKSDLLPVLFIIAR